MSNAIENYQMEGEAATIKHANAYIAAAMHATPTNLLHLFRSYIHFESGRYLFGWILR
jgi:hypothetical protein